MRAYECTFENTNIFEIRKNAIKRILFTLYTLSKQNISRKRRRKSKHQIGSGWD